MHSAMDHDCTLNDRFGKPSCMTEFEQEIREDERSSNFTPDDHSNGMTEAYQRGFDDARWIAAKEALEGVQHENCDCGPCQAIHRALAELRTIGHD